MSENGIARFELDADVWNSTISFYPGILVQLGGILELTFAADVEIASQVGRSFQLFDWTHVTPEGAFAISGGESWDTTQL